MNVTQAFLARSLKLISKKWAKTNTKTAFYCFFSLHVSIRSRESERSCSDVHELPWHRHAGPRAPASTRYGSAGVHSVPQLWGPRTENQPQGSLQTMRRAQDCAAEEDPGGPHWQRWERKAELSSSESIKLKHGRHLVLSPAAGMRDGQKLVFHGEGDQEPGLEPGDIIIVLDQREHSLFTR